MYSNRLVPIGIHERKENVLMKKNKKNMFLLILIILCIISIFLMIVVMILKQNDMENEFVPPSFDTTAELGVPTVPENLEWNELDAKAYKVSVCGVVNINEDEAQIWLTNPSSNSVWIKLRIMNENDVILGESGLIKPGEYVENVTISSTIDSGDKVKLKIMSYQPETYYSEGAITINTMVRKEG